MNKVSVIVPVYNANLYLNRCIESIIKQTYGNLEIILIDDGSTDGSSELCDKLKEKDQRIIVIHQNNKGVSAARNRGIETASGEYITFCDADDYYENDKVEIQLNTLLKHNVDVSIIGIQVDYPTGKSRSRFNTGKEYEWRLPNTEHIRFFLRDELFPFSQYALLIKKEICKQVRFWEGKRINEDKFFCYEILKLANGVAYLSMSKYHYILQKESATHSQFGEKYFDAIAIAKIIEEDVKNTYPELKKYAELNTYRALVSTLKYIEKDKRAVHQYKSERKKIVTEIRADKYNFAKNELIWKRKLDLQIMLSFPLLYSKMIRMYSFITKKLHGGV